MGLTEILTAFDVGRTEFGNLYRAGYFSTPFRGDEHRFAPTRQNALDIGFLTRLRAVGFRPSVACSEVRAWLHEEERGSFAQMWLANPRASNAARLGRGFTALPSDFADIEMADDFVEGRPRAAPTKTATTFVAVNRAEIVRRVDQLFGR